MIYSTHATFTDLDESAMFTKNNAPPNR